MKRQIFCTSKTPCLCHFQKTGFLYICSFSNNGMQKRFRRCLATHNLLWSRSHIMKSRSDLFSSNFKDFLDISTSELFFQFFFILDDFAIFRNRDFPRIPVFLQFLILFQRIHIPKTIPINLRHIHILNLYFF